MRGTFAFLVFNREEKMKCVQKSGLQTKGKYKVVNKLIEHAATCTCTRYESLKKWSVLKVRTYKPAAEQILI